MKTTSPSAPPQFSLFGSTLVSPSVDLSAQERGAVYTPDALAEWVARHLASLLTPVVENPVILDPACGDGALLRAFSLAWGAPSQLVGIDLDRATVEAAKGSFLADATFFQADALAPKGANTGALAQWQKGLRRARIEQVDGVIANPPWGASVQWSRGQLQSLGYELARGQYDSYELFIELCLQLAAPGAMLAFIVPDSLFLPEHQSLRTLLLRETRLLLLARLGEGFFPGVFRGTVVLIFQKVTPTPDHEVRCFRFNREWRNAVLKGEKTFEEAEQSLCHLVPQERFAADVLQRFDIDAQQSETPVLEKFAPAPLPWTHGLTCGRGVEISKVGVVMLCPNCRRAHPKPREGQSNTYTCRFCEINFWPDNARTQEIVRRIDTATAPQTNLMGEEAEEWCPLIVGEDVDRYSCRPSRLIRLGVEGVNYKPRATFAPRKLLVRKTGVGLKGAIDESGALTNQVVFHFSLDPTRRTPGFYLDYVQGVLCSRVLFAYYLKRIGENEWRSHPYITQKVLSELPIPALDESNLRQGQAIAEAVQEKALSFSRSEAPELRIEGLVAGLFGFTPSDCEWVLRVLDEAEGLEPIRTLRLTDPGALQPIFVA